MYELITKHKKGRYRNDIPQQQQKQQRRQHKEINNPYHQSAQDITIKGKKNSTKTTSQWLMASPFSKTNRSPKLFNKRPAKSPAQVNEEGHWQMSWESQTGAPCSKQRGNGGCGVASRHADTPPPPTGRGAPAVQHSPVLTWSNSEGDARAFASTCSISLRRGESCHNYIFFSKGKEGEKRKLILKSIHATDDGLMVLNHMFLFLCILNAFKTPWATGIPSWHPLSLGVEEW